MTLSSPLEALCWLLLVPLGVALALHLLSRWSRL